MLILETIIHDVVWGGEKIGPQIGMLGVRIGHLYSLVDQKGVSNRILNGNPSEKDFGSWFAVHKERFGMGRFSEFPFVVAIVDAKENLSLQVHPDDERARALEGAGFGKNESFYFLESPPRGTIASCPVDTLEEVQAILECGNPLDLVEYSPVAKGDYLYVQAGTLHALCAGSLAYEIEENVPYTYRVYDWGRLGDDGLPRPLQIEKALQCIRPGLRAQARPMRARETERLYETWRVDGRQMPVGPATGLECWTALGGSHELDGIPVRLGTTVVLEPGESMPPNNATWMVAAVNKEACLA